MSSAARSVFVFGIYLFGTAGTLLLAPNVLLRTAGLPPTDEVWIRVVGVAVASLAVYYVVAARNGYEAIFRATVWVRLGVLLAFAAFVALGLVPAGLILFGGIDAVGAAWTWSALRATAARR